MEAVGDISAHISEKSTKIITHINFSTSSKARSLQKIFLTSDLHSGLFVQSFFPQSLQTTNFYIYPHL